MSDLATAEINNSASASAWCSLCSPASWLAPPKKKLKTSLISSYFRPTVENVGPTTLDLWKESFTKEAVYHGTPLQSDDKKLKRPVLSDKSSIGAWRKYRHRYEGTGTPIVFLCNFWPCRLKQCCARAELNRPCCRRPVEHLINTKEEVKYKLAAQKAIARINAQVSGESHDTGKAAPCEICSTSTTRFVGFNITAATFDGDGVPGGTTLEISISKPCFLVFDRLCDCVSCRPIGVAWINTLSKAYSNYSSMLAHLPLNLVCLVIDYMNEAINWGGILNAARQAQIMWSTRPADVDSVRVARKAVDLRRKRVREEYEKAAEEFHLHASRICQENSKLEKEANVLKSIENHLSRATAPGFAGRFPPDLLERAVRNTHRVFPRPSPAHEDWMPTFDIPAIDELTTAIAPVGTRLNPIEELEETSDSSNSDTRSSSDGEE